VSQLKKFFKETNPNDRAVNIDDINLQSNLSYKENPIRILDRAERKTRNRVTKFVKAQWSRHSVREATWEQEDQLRKHYPNLFLDEYVYS
jgi:predicted Ser/Thr protein kinase